MAALVGHDAEVAVGLQADYYTAATLDEMIPIISENLVQDWIFQDDLTLRGRGGMAKPSRHGKNVGGSFKTYGVFDEISDVMGIELLLYSLFGTVSGVNPGNTHRYTPTDVLAKFLTLGVNKQEELHEFVSLKMDSMNFIAEQDGNVEIDWSCAFWDRFRTGDGGITNSMATITAMSPKNVTRLSWQDMTFRIGDTADALSSSDAIQTSRVSVAFENSLGTGVHASKDGSNHTDSKLIIEPKPVGHKTCALEFTVPRYDSTTIMGWYDNFTDLQVDVKFATGSYKFSMFMPMVKIMGMPVVVEGPGTQEVTVTCGCYVNDGDHTVMKYENGSTNVTDLFSIETLSGRAAVPS